MKIAVIAKRVSRSLGGAERVSVYLSGKLADAGHDVHMFTFHSDLRMDSVHCHEIRVSKWFSPWRLLSFQRKVRRRIASNRFDLVYSLCQVYPVDIYRVGDGIHRHWMIIQYPHVARRWTKYLTSLVHLAMRYLENRIFEEGNCRHFITNSVLVKTQIMKYFRVPNEKITVVYNGVDHEIFRPAVKKYRDEMRVQLRIDTKELVLLFAANNWERKGLSTVLKAMAETENAGITLLIVGRGRKKEYLSMAGKLGLSPDKILFEGRTAAIEKYYGAADIFVLPSRYEPFANVCLEAMACGLPVVTTKGNGASELVIEGINGFVLEDWEDAKRLSEILGMLTAPDVRGAVGMRAAETATHFTWERHLEETNKVFFSLLGQQYTEKKTTTK